MFPCKLLLWAKGVWVSLCCSCLLCCCLRDLLILSLAPRIVDGWRHSLAERRPCVGVSSQMAHAPAAMCKACADASKPHTKELQLAC